MDIPVYREYREVIKLIYILCRSVERGLEIVLTRNILSIKVHY